MQTIYQHFYHCNLSLLLQQEIWANVRELMAVHVRR